jgi:serine/threonine-protein kinase
LTDTAADRLQAALADRYRIERELGRGGMATVYLAHDLKHDRLVALKVLHPELAAMLGPDRFLREIRTTARLDHPHILPVFDSGDAGGLLWYTMPYVEGESLRDRLRREVQLPIEEAVRIAREVAEALDYAHRHGIVHRDIKPENILLGERHARVADFGVARAVEAGGGGKLTETGLAVGTPAYMSPEQATGGPVDARSDVYALGCVVYEMLAGEPPYTGPTAQAVIGKRLSEPVPHLGSVRLVSLTTEAAIARALAKAPADRFTTAGEFVAALQAGATLPLPPTREAAPRKPVARLALAGVLALLTLGGVYGLWRRSSVPRVPESGNVPMVAPVSPPTAATGPSVAVLPFTNLSPAAENEYFSDGMTEELITALGKVPGLRVAARTSAFAFKGRNADVREIGRQLNVGTVVEGSVRRAGRQLRVTAQLINVADGYHLWADEYDRELRDVFQVQGELARAIVSALRVPLRLSERSDTALVRAATSDPEAHDLYLQGRFHWNSRTREGLQKAVRYFREAIGRDSAYAPAYAGLADAFLNLADYRFLRGIQAIPEARIAARRALELDRTVAEAHASLGGVLESEQNWAGAEAEYRRAITLNPNYSTAHQWYAMLLVKLPGRFNEALPEIRWAQALDPLSLSVNNDLALVLAISGDYEHAIQQFRNTLELNPGYPWALLGLGSTYAEMGRYQEAVRMLQKALELVPGDAEVLANLAIVHARTGRQDEARKILDQLKSAPVGKHSTLHIALVYAWLGERDAAFQWLDRVHWDARSLIPAANDPQFAPIRSDPRYARLLRKLDLK